MSAIPTVSTHAAVGSDRRLARPALHSKPSSSLGSRYRLAYRAVAARSARPSRSTRATEEPRSSPSRRSKVSGGGGSGGAGTAQGRISALRRDRLRPARRTSSLQGGRRTREIPALKRWDRRDDPAEGEAAPRGERPFQGALVETESVAHSHGPARPRVAGSPLATSTASRSSETPGP